MQQLQQTNSFHFYMSKLFLIHQDFLLIIYQNLMQTKSKQLKSKKTTESSSNNVNRIIEDYLQLNQDEYVPCGAICRDGTYTSINGRGAGSRHDGVKHKLYAKKSQLENDDNGLESKYSLSANTSTAFSSKSQKSEIKEAKDKSQISNSQRKKSKKISLKQAFKTKAKRSSLFNKVNEIFQTSYKDEFQFIQEEIVDEMWILFASISNLYDQLNEVNQIVLALEQNGAHKSQFTSQLPKQQSKKSTFKAEQLKADFDILSKQNKFLEKEIQKLTKENQKIKESLVLYKLKEKNFKKMLKIIEKSDPKTLNNALQVSMISIEDLKLSSKPQSRVTTRSMVKKSSKKQQKIVESIFSSDESSDFYHEDNTIRNIMKIMK